MREDSQRFFAYYISQCIHAINELSNHVVLSQLGKNTTKFSLQFSGTWVATAELSFKISHTFACPFLKTEKRKNLQNSHDFPWL